jgi:hypothetical protein
MPLGLAGGVGSAGRRRRGPRSDAEGRVWWGGWFVRCQDGFCGEAIPLGLGAVGGQGVDGSAGGGKGVAGRASRRDELLEGVAGGAGSAVVQSRLVAFSAFIVSDLMIMWKVT